MTQLLLHIGGEKTGTTALQRYLLANSKALLAQRSVLYPDAPPLCFNAAHFAVVNTFLSRAPLEFMTRQKVMSPADLKTAVAAALGSAKPRLLLLSAEHFSSRLRRAQVEQLAAWCRGSGLFETIRIIFYARPQDSLAVSALSTQMRVGSRGWITDMQFSRDNNYFNHFRTARLWAEAFGAGAVTVRRYDSGLDIVADFLAAAGIERPGGEIAPERLNAGMSYATLRLLYLVNQHLALASDPGAAPAEVERDAQARLRIRRLAEEKLASDQRLPAEVVLTPALRSKIRAVFAEPNRNLKATFGIDLNSAEDATDDPAVALPSDAEIMARAMVEMARELPKPRK